MLQRFLGSCCPIGVWDRLRRNERWLQRMRMSYYPETDSLYIDLADQPSNDSKEVSEGVVLDYDANGDLVGIDIDNASKKLDLKKLTLNKISAETKTLLG